ncbi:AAA family ATPase [Corynebacterium sp. LK2510]|uniref:AAA family ATPase n=1 Tax=Corynebacterium sp. LK2510 TaxID=3110472 RepID=UPI0034D00A79
MQIHDLVLDNVRAIRHLELHDLPATGVIVIEGENETGKSTILDALDAVLNEKHSSTRESIRSLEPIGRDEGPEVTLTATVGPYTFTAHKRFRRRKLSELHITAPQRQQLTGREADDKLAAILHEHLDADLVRTLFLRQGGIEPGIAAAGIPSVTRALDSSDGGEATAAEDTELTARIAREYQRYYDQKGKEKIALKRLRTEVDELTAQVEAKRAEVRELADAVDEVDRKNADIAAADAELPGAREELAQRESEVAAARVVREKAEAAREALERATIDASRAEDDLAARVDAREHLAELEADGEKLAEQIESARARASEESETVAGLVAAREASRSELAAAREGVAHARTVRDRARSHARRAELGELLAAIDEAGAELERLHRDEPERPVTADDVRRIEKAAGEVAVQRRLAEATAAKLDVVSETDAAITVDGEERAVTTSEVTTLSLREGTEIVLGSFTAVYRAGAGDSASGDALKEAERELAEALAPTGCADLDSARAVRDEHAAQASKVAAARSALADLSAGRDIQALRAELARLIEAEEANVEAGAPDALDIGAAEEALSAAETARDAAEKAVAQAEAELQPWEEKRAATALLRLETQQELKDAERSAAAAQLAAAEEATSEEQLVKSRDAAATARATAEAAARELSAQLDSVNPELAEELLCGADNRLRALTERREAAEKRTLLLTSYINHATGVAEQADRAEAALETAQSQLDRTLRRAEAAKLLWETMSRHRDEARARYAQPFARALASHASVVFGHDVEFTLNDDLEVAERTVGDTTVALKGLSGGAQEQMAILTRFAIAELAGRSENGSVTVPVVVDDALGATDPRRLALMNSLFNRAGRGTQVFVLTCDPHRFDRVDAARRYSIGQLRS